MNTTGELMGETIAATAARVKAAAQIAPTERLLTLKAIAEVGGVSRWTVWRWHTEEGLRVVKIGNVCRVRQSDWLAFLEKHAATTEGNGNDGN